MLWSGGGFCHDDFGHRGCGSGFIAGVEDDNGFVNVFDESWEVRGDAVREEAEEVVEGEVESAVFRLREGHADSEVWISEVIEEDAVAEEFIEWGVRWVRGMGGNVASGGGGEKGREGGLEGTVLMTERTEGVDGGTVSVGVAMVGVSGEGM